MDGSHRQRPGRDHVEQMFSCNKSHLSLPVHMRKNGIKNAALFFRGRRFKILRCLN